MPNEWQMNKKVHYILKNGCVSSIHCLHPYFIFQLSVVFIIDTKKLQIKNLLIKTRIYFSVASQSTFSFIKGENRDLGYTDTEKEKEFF